VIFDLVVIGIFLAIPVAAAVAVGGTIALVFWSRLARIPVVRSVLDRFAQDRTSGRWRRALPACIAVLSVLLVLGAVPRRAAFLLSRPAFQRRVATAQVSDYEGERLKAMLGVYYVDEYAADRRGGVYFRTHAGLAGFGSDTLSYGFAFRPNAEGSPFGNSHYRISPLVGDWYAFSASDHW